MNSALKTSLRAQMKAERQCWQLAGGLLGGWPTLAMVASAVMMGWVLFLWALSHPLRVYREIDWVVMTSVSAIAINAAFLGVILAIIIVLRERREHGLLRLSPNVGPLIFGLNARLALAALLCLPPAIALRALMAMKDPNSLAAVISLADVPMQGFLIAGLTLVYLAILIVVTFGWLRAPTRLVGFPIAWGVTLWSGSTGQWLPLIACIVIVIGHRLWLRTDTANVARARPIKRPQQPNVIERINRLRLRRAAQAMGDRRSRHRVTALLTTRSSALFTTLTVLATTAHIALAPALFDAFLGGWVFAYIVVALLAAPTPIPLGQIMLLPLGAERHNVGRILMSVWMRDVRCRLLLSVALGLILRALFGWLELFSFMRPPFAGVGDELMLFVMKPLMNAAGLYGAALALCWTISASPRLLAKPGLLAVLPMIVVTGFMALGAGIGWVLGQAVPALNSRDMGAVRFAIINGAVLPMLAWWINRQLRRQWLCANLDAISTAMQAWATRRQKTQLVL